MRKIGIPLEINYNKISQFVYLQSSITKDILILPYYTLFTPLAGQSVESLHVPLVSQLCVVCRWACSWRGSQWRRRHAGGSGSACRL